MSDLQTIGFTNQDDDKYGKLTIVDIPHEVATRQPRFNQTLTTVNDAVVRLGIYEGEFPWHKHDDQDEFFLVLAVRNSGSLRRIEGRLQKSPKKPIIR